MTSPIKVLALFAHPDDAEFLCAGTLAHLSDRGAKIHIATMTAGDCGSTTLSAEEIACVRRNEATRAAKMVKGGYTCLREKDLLVFYDRKTLRKTVELVREIVPALVFTHSPADYMVDHETTSRLCQTACFSGMAPNYTTSRASARPLSRIPHLYYAQPIGDRDILGVEIRPKLLVDITNTMERKESMLACHESQIEWLRSQQDIQDLLGTVRNAAERAGKLAGTGLAEGFRQHLGQGFPQDDLLKHLLGHLAHMG